MAFNGSSGASSILGSSGCVSFEGAGRDKRSGELDPSGIRRGVRRPFACTCDFFG